MTAKDFWREFRLPVSGPLSEWHPPDMVYNYAEAYVSHRTAQMREALQQIKDLVRGSKDSGLSSHLAQVEILTDAALSGSGEHAPQRPQKDIADLEHAAGLLEQMYDLYENGDDVYENPDELEGHLGKAMILNDLEDEIIYVLNKLFPQAEGEQPRARQVGGWVKCSERLPNDKTDNPPEWAPSEVRGHWSMRVTVFHADGRYAVDAYYHLSEGDSGFWLSRSDDITHWRPLPSAPRKEGGKG